MYHGLPNQLFYRAARHETNPLYVTLWNVIANLDMEPITLLGSLALSGSLLTKIAYSGTDQLPSVNNFTTGNLPSVYVNIIISKIIEIDMFVKRTRSRLL